MHRWHLRQATLDDAPVIAALAQETFCDTFNHYPPDDRAAHLAQYYTSDVFASQMQKGTQIWLAETEGQPVAYAQIGAYKLPLPLPVQPAIELYKLYVRHGWKRHKIGGALMDKIFILAEEARARAIYLGVWEGNRNAQRFYARYGFEKVGEYDYPPIGAITDREWIMRRLI